MNGNNFKIIPAVLESEVSKIQEKVDLVKGKTKTIGVDIIDGIFADNLTVGVADLELVEFGDLEVEVQLMTEYPTELLGECKSVGVGRVFGHIEKMGSQVEFVETTKELGLLPGLGLDLYTPVDSIDDQVLEETDGVLLMGVKAGFSGQKFNDLVLDKVVKLREMGFGGGIQIDGGINPQTLKKCIEVGADEFSVTSYLWESGDPVMALEELVKVG